MFFRARSALSTRCIPAWILAVLFAIGLIVPSSFAQDEDDDPSATAVELFQQGQDAHEKGEFGKAIELYERAIGAVKEFPEAEFQRGNALMSLNRREDAEKAFRKAVETRPDWSLPLASLGSLMVGRGAYAEAEPFLKKALALDAQNSMALSALTELRLRTKAPPSDLKELLSRLVAQTERAKPTASAWAARAALEVALGEKAAARRSFDRALTLDPNNQFALVSKAGSMLDEDDTAGAEAITRRLETLAPGSADVQVLKARILYATGDHDKAIATLNSIAEQSAEVVALRDKMQLGGKEDPAELEKQLEKDPKDAFVLGKLCSIFRTGDPAKALSFCRRASEADPQNLNHAIGFAAALVQAKMFAESVDILRRIEAISPENVTVRANLATALFQLKRYAEAKTEYEWITGKQPTSAIAYYFLGITHDQLSEYADAMANYQLFLKYADGDKNKLEIEKVNLRLPILQKQIKEKKGKKS